MAILLTKRLRGVNRVENLLVVLKIAVVLLFVIVGITAIHPENYHPFLPAHKPGTSFGGVTGVMAGAAQIFVAYGALM